MPYARLQCLESHEFAAEEFGSRSDPVIPLRANRRAWRRYGCGHARRPETCHGFPPNQRDNAGSKGVIALSPKSCTPSLLFDRFTRNYARIAACIHARHGR